MGERPLLESEDQWYMSTSVSMQCAHKSSTLVFFFISAIMIRSTIAYPCIGRHLSFSSRIHGRKLSSSHYATKEETSSEWYPDYSPYKSSFEFLTERQWQLLNQLALKLYDWNSKVNLISRKDIDYLLPNHIVPCLSISRVRRVSILFLCWHLLTVKKAAVNALTTHKLLTSTRSLVPVSQSSTSGLVAVSLVYQWRSWILTLNLPS
jgi:hypothetical protein